MDPRRNRILVVVPGVLLTILAAASLCYATYTRLHVRPPEVVEAAPAEGVAEHAKSVGQLKDAPISFCIYAVILAGGLAMVRGRAWSLAMTAAVFASLPCPNMFCITLPVGIWSVIVLASPGGRAAFLPDPPKSKRPQRDS